MNTLSDQIIVKTCNILSELKQNWKSLWFNKNTIDMELEDSIILFYAIKNKHFYFFSLDEQSIIFHSEKLS